MGKRVDIPEQAYTWLTSEVQEKLKAISEPHLAKKRITVVKLAFARANQQRLDDVFEEPDTCARVIWYTKWKDDPVIAAAYEACYQRILDWKDEQTTAILAHYRQVRLERMAEVAAEAPLTYRAVMEDANQSGATRISAANAAITWADPEAAGKAAPAQPPPPDQNFNLSVYLSQLKDDELDTILSNLETAAGGSTAGKVAAEA